MHWQCTVGCWLQAAWQGKVDIFTVIRFRLGTGCGPCTILIAYHAWRVKDIATLLLALDAAQQLSAQLNSPGNHPTVPSALALRTKLVPVQAM